MSAIALLSAAHIHTQGYLEEISTRSDCELVAVWDEREERGRHCAQQHGAVFDADLGRVVTREDIDGFLICAENTRHLPLLEAAIPRGKPIFCEKPLVTSAAAAAKALELIRSTDTIVHMGYFQPFSATMGGIAQALAAGRLGTVTHARFRNAHHAAYGRWFDSPDLAWFHDPELAGGGAFMDMGTHAIHLLRTLLGPVERVAAVIGNASGVYPRVDDHGLALLRFAAGALGTVEASWVQTGGIGGLEITGSEGTLYQHPDLGYVIAAPGREPEPVTPAAARPTRVARLLAAVEGRLDRAEFDADLRCAADAVCIMEACYQASESGGWIEVRDLNGSAHGEVPRSVDR